MRFHIHACFDTVAKDLILSANTSESAAVLVADGCAVELRIAPVKSDAASSAGALPATHTLTALPWDSSRLRLCVNGIGYGTGPLTLRDGDRITLRPSSSRGAATLYTYTIKVVATAASVDAHKVDDDVPLTARAIASEENDRLHAIMSNAEHYAKWNNFYSERFTNLSTARLPQLNGTRPSGMLHKCVCGSYVVTEAGPSGAHPRTACAPDALQSPVVLDANATVNSQLPSVRARVLVTLLPSHPQILEHDSSAAQPQGEVDVRLPAVCCCCPFTSTSSDPALRRYTEKSCCTSAAMPFESADEANGSRNVVKTAPPSCADAPETSWAAYVHARQRDWGAAQRISHAKKAADAPRVDPLAGDARLDRPISELLNRISFLESALMGVRYE
ncbi:hypothetical protein LSCM1_02269 [Leishmania martiniquensis]|uniref:Uncharacterized protein n=1 Tax=Leishmania martiniquensis TaxID=1580590 RepID=A0A836KEX3_9TRYP|nr:hypothetical protein LSCM1_02269 [Leishmania martiniquensis]